MRDGDRSRRWLDAVTSNVVSGVVLYGILALLDVVPAPSPDMWVRIVMTVGIGAAVVVAAVERRRTADPAARWWTAWVVLSGGLVLLLLAAAWITWVVNR